MENKEEQELMMKLGMFEQQIHQLQQQLQAVEQGIVELTSLNFGLDELKKGREILSPIGRGIFAKTELMSEDLTVDIGSKNFVKKNIPETKKIIQEQVKRLNEIKDD
jgi:prefoldin alpha subunit